MPANIGRMNTLRVLKEKDFGVYVDGEQLGEILLPKRYVPKGLKVGQEVDVFIYLDSEDELIATTIVPDVEVGQFAGLPVVAVNQVGAFFDWGLPKDLLVPFSQQKVRVEEGERHLLFVYLDQVTNRIVATTKVDALLNREEPPYRTGDKVDIIIGDKTNIGFKCIVDSRFWGVLFFQDAVGQVRKGDKMPAFIKRVRDDGKIDLSIQQTGYKKVTGILEDIVEYLEKNNGEMTVTDKSSPQEIFRIFNVSKATFKKALGALYKDQKIELSKDKVRLK
ncbi:GntR family transcriptional regulator [Marinomonas piezotolerans]|uniref:GntR family transcriptional regulator n=1 Tax=Marinomonas piezotolerans TaxID=2213058 RepID=A0A370UED5_9GAMM|nr:S1-like domain-containing RNA-binding protein [Marinomonas piezotolerans]RDL46142.1 GntR family transcriptional regulator [Marinomonas piezotolerans]